MLNTRMLHEHYNAQRNWSAYYKTFFVPAQTSAFQWWNNFRTERTVQDPVNKNKEPVKVRIIAYCELNQVLN
jgi:hypothetical protein